jgi:MYXO-CTERM domain-containing protein
MVEPEVNVNAMVKMQRLHRAAHPVYAETLDEMGLRVSMKNFDPVVTAEGGDLAIVGALGKPGTMHAGTYLHYVITPDGVEGFITYGMTGPTPEPELGAQPDPDPGGGDPDDGTDDDDGDSANPGTGPSDRDDDDRRDDSRDDNGGGSNDGEDGNDNGGEDGGEGCAMGPGAGRSAMWGWLVLGLIGIAAVRRRVAALLAGRGCA